MVAPSDATQFHDAMVVRGQKMLYLESASNPPIASACQNEPSEQRHQNEAAQDQQEVVEKALQLDKLIPKATPTESFCLRTRHNNGSIQKCREGKRRVKRKTPIAMMLTMMSQRRKEEFKSLRLAKTNE